MTCTNWPNPKIEQIVADYNIKPDFPRHRRIMNHKSLLDLVQPFEKTGIDQRYKISPQNEGLFCPNMKSAKKTNIFFPLKLNLSPYELGYQAVIDHNSVIDLIKAQQMENSFLPQIISNISARSCSTQTRQERERNPSGKKSSEKNVIIDLQEYDDSLQDKKLQFTRQMSHQSPSTDYATWQLQAAQAVRDLYAPKKNENNILQKTFTFPEPKQSQIKIKTQICKPKMSERTCDPDKPNSTLLRPQMIDQFTSVDAKITQLANTASSTSEMIGYCERSCSPIISTHFQDKNCSTEDFISCLLVDQSTSPREDLNFEDTIQAEDQKIEKVILLETDLPNQPVDFSKQIIVDSDPPLIEDINPFEIQVINFVEMSKNDPIFESKKTEHLHPVATISKSDSCVSICSYDLDPDIDSLLNYIEIGDESKYKDVQRASLVVEGPLKSSLSGNVKCDSNINNWMRNTFKTRNQNYIQDRSLAIKQERLPFSSKKNVVNRRTTFSEVKAKQKRSSEAYKMALANLMSAQKNQSEKLEFSLQRKKVTTEKPSPQKLQKLYGTSRLSSINNMLSKNQNHKKFDPLKSVNSANKREEMHMDEISLVSSNDIIEDIDWAEIDRIISA